MNARSPAAPLRTGLRRTAGGRPAATTQELPDTGNAGARLMFVLAILMLLFTMGRLGEVVSFLHSIPIAKLLLAAALLTMVVARGRTMDLSPFRETPARLAVALFVMCAVSLLYSAWRSQTLTFVTTYLPMLAMLVVVIAGTTFTMERLRLITLAGMFSGVPLAIGASLEAASGRVKFGFTYDPNDLAYLLAALMPLLIARSQVTTSKLLKLACYGALGVYAMAAVLTQSRGGMIGIALMSTYLAWKGVVVVDPGGRYCNRGIGRWKRIAILGVIGVIGILAMPGDAKQRLGTIFDLSNDYNVTAADNDNGRLAIWKRGLTVLVSRPWGVGANAYPIADYMAGGRYITAHNSTLQAFVELGLVGGALFLAILVSTWRLAGRARKRAMAMTPTSEITELIALLTAVRAGLIVIVVSGSFLSQAYGHILYVLLTFCVCAVRLLERKIDANPVNEVTAVAVRRFGSRPKPVAATARRPTV